MRTLFTALVTAAVLNATPSHAAFCSRTLSFSDGSVLTAAQLNDEFNAITNCANSIDNANVASSAAILPEKLNSTIAGDGIARDGSTGVLSVNDDDSSLTISSDILSIKASGVTTAKIADSNVTTVKIADSNVTTAKIADLNVTTGKLADNAVTQAKRAALGHQLSSEVTTFSTLSTTAVDVTNATLSITTTGRPVFVGFISTTTASPFGGLFGGCILKMLRDATVISLDHIGILNTAAGTYASPSSYWHIDVPSAGTYTYKLQGYTSGALTCRVQNMKMIAYEL